MTRRPDRHTSDPAGPAADVSEHRSQASSQQGSSGEEQDAGQRQDENALGDAREQRVAGGESFDDLKAEVEEAHKRVLLAQADLENFRKRTRRDYEQQLQYASLPLIHDILEVLDNLRRALQASEKTDAAARLHEGVALVVHQMEEVLAKHGCRRIPAVGQPFDPNVHEAISQMASEEHPAGTVMLEATVGYQLHERVVRPSQVVVSTGSDSSS